MKILALGAHPDDVEIGVGGTLIKYAQKGYHVTVVVAIVSTLPDVRKKECHEAAEIMGIDINFLEMDPNEMIMDRHLVGRFDELFMKEKPDVIFTHWNHDSHQDHIAFANGALASARRNNCSFYMYEQTIPGGIVPYAFKPQLYIDITDVIDQKLASIRAHRSQFKKNGEWWEYGIKGRAMYRGYQINVKYAEAFEVVKQINRL